MKKDEFFQILRKKLAIIEENELNDILSEYEQHIAMKMENGKITEEEAIKDFGNIEELVAEILESYHVKVNYNAQLKEEKQAQFKESAKELGENTKHFCGKVVQKTKEVLKNGWNSVKVCFEKIWNQIKKVVKVEREEQTLLLGTDKRLPENIQMMQEKQRRGSRWFQKLTSWVWKVIRGCFRLGMWAIKIAWNLFIAGIVFLVGIFTCIMLYIFGASLVFLVMDYPLWGVLLVSLGTVIFSAAVAIALTFFIKRRKGKKAIFSDKTKTIIKIGIVSFAGIGILLTGIGTGIGVMEFSTFVYGGEQPIFEEEKTTSKVIAEIPLDNTGKIELEEVYNGREFVKAEVTFDASVPMGQVWYEIERNQNEIEYFAVVENYYEYDYDQPEEEQQYKGEIYHVRLGQNYGDSNLKLMMQLKDKFMKDLKERKLYSYYSDDIKSIKVLANPQMKQYFEGIK